MQHYIHHNKYLLTNKLLYRSYIHNKLMTSININTTQQQLQQLLQRRLYHYINTIQHNLTMLNINDPVHINKNIHSTANNNYSNNVNTTTDITQHTTHNQHIYTPVSLDYITPTNIQFDKSIQQWLISDFQGCTIQLHGKLTRDQAVQCIKYINQYMIEVFEYGNSWYIIHRACDICDTNALIHCFIADYYIARQDAQAAKDRIELAKQCINNNSNKRDILYVNIFEQWLSGNVPHALALLEQCIDEYQHDLFAGKKAQLLAFLTGNKHKMLTLMIDRPQWLERPYYHAMIAFAKEQNSDEQGAYEAGIRGNELHPHKHDIWAIHALAHVFYTTGQSNCGLDMLNQHRGLLDTRMSFLYTHCNFHICLFLIDLCRFSQLQNIYDTYIWYVIYIVDDNKITCFVCKD